MSSRKVKKKSDTLKGISSLFTFNTKKLSGASGQASGRKPSSQPRKQRQVLEIDCGGIDAFS